MIEFDLDKTGYLAIWEKGAFDMVDAQIILKPNEVEELKKVLTLTDVVSNEVKCCEELNRLKEIIEQDNSHPCTCNRYDD